YISTGQQDSKFGFDLAGGAAYEGIKQAMAKPHLDVLGVHSHIGSQIFEVEGFRMAAAKVAEFAVQVRDELGLTFRVINLGGGFGIRYTAEDKPLPAAVYVEAITDAIRSNFEPASYPLPEIWTEPGRSIVGDAGTTLYTVGKI